MREHPILFSAEMVRAILEGRKTQTRRVIKPQPPEWCDFLVLSGAGRWQAHNPNSQNASSPASLGWQCPYGRHGDYLWVRETWASLWFSYAGEFGEQGWVDDWGEVEPNDVKLYRQKREEGHWRSEKPTFDIVYKADWGDEPKNDRGFSWRPSIFMPRWASRITLEVVSVRAERVQDITAQDAVAEGWPADDWARLTATELQSSISGNAAIDWFANLWDSINAGRSEKKWLVKPWDLWLWGRDEHDDPENVALDVRDPGAIQWRDPEELGPDYEFHFFRDSQPPKDGYYEVAWEKDGLVEYVVYLRQAEPVKGEDYIQYNYSWSSNPWAWIVEFRQI